jgi:methionyl aminopeptidase
VGGPGRGASRRGGCPTSVTPSSRRSTRPGQPPRYGLLEEYTGHGIGTSMHEPPLCPTWRPRARVAAWCSSPGIVLAVEPMATLGSAEVEELDDGWTVVTVDGRQASHWEHTVASRPTGPGCSPPWTAARPGWGTPSRA